jgi:hypothetical protein
MQLYNFLTSLNDFYSYSLILMKLDGSLKLNSCINLIQNYRDVFDLDTLARVIDYNSYLEEIKD